MTRILVPVRLNAWMVGELGKSLHEEFRAELHALLDKVDVTRLVRGFLVETSECEGPAVEIIARAVSTLESTVQEAYPVFHKEMGPVWTGTLQVIFPEVKI